MSVAMRDVERLERGPAVDIREFQARLLRRRLEHLRSEYPFHTRRLGEWGVDVPVFDFLRRLPTMDKRVLEEFSEELSPPADDVVEIAYSSGTTGSPLAIPFTEAGLKRLEWNERRAFSVCGLSKNDTVLLTCTMDRCFIAGLAYQLGCRAIGAAAIRVGAAPLGVHWNVIREIRPTVIVGVPSFLAKLAESAARFGCEAGKSGVAKLVCIGEPLRGYDLEPLPLTRKIENLWHAAAFSTYASTEVCAAFCECERQSGGHLVPELAIVEILDDDGSPLPPGETGEVTLTPLGDGAAPLLRFRTGDMSFLIDEPCSCGRKTPRLGPIVGRKHQLIKHKGTAFYPNAIHAALGALDCVVEHQVVAIGDNLSDDVRVLVALQGEGSLERVEETLRAALRVGVLVEEVPPDELLGRVFPDGKRKPSRFVREERHPRI